MEGINFGKIYLILNNNIIRYILYNTYDFLDLLYR